MPPGELMPRRVDPSLVPAKPNLAYEKLFWAMGLEHVAGIDEAGRGALAGPVYAAVVILPTQAPTEVHLDGVRDSKEMSILQREAWAPKIQAAAEGWAIGSASPEEIDIYGIVPATRLAAMRALESLNFQPVHLLIDALNLPECPIPQTSLLKGDKRCLSIAAASVLAKVARDAKLRSLDSHFPDYGFAHHKGYATKVHRRAIASLGPCQQHRRTFAPLREQ